MAIHRTSSCMCSYVLQEQHCLEQYPLGPQGLKKSPIKNFSETEVCCMLGFHFTVGLLDKMKQQLKWKNHEYEQSEVKYENSLFASFQKKNLV